MGGERWGVEMIWKSDGLMVVEARFFRGFILFLGARREREGENWVREGKNWVRERVYSRRYIGECENHSLVSSHQAIALPRMDKAWRCLS